MSLAVCGIGVAYSIPYWPIVGRYIDSRDHASSAQVGFRFNSYIALAVSETLLGDGGLLYIAILIGVCVPIFNIAAIWPMTRHGKQGFLRELARNPLIWATTAGLSANLLGFMVPEWLDPSVTRVGQAGLVLGLMGAGAGMHLSALPRAKVMAVSVLSVKHIAMPLIAFAMARLWQLDTLQTSTLLIFSALPTASSCYVLAARMGLQRPLRVQLGHRVHRPRGPESALRPLCLIQHYLETAPDTLAGKTTSKRVKARRSSTASPAARADRTCRASHAASGLRQPCSEAVSTATAITASGTF